MQSPPAAFVQNRLHRNATRARMRNATRRAAVAAHLAAIGVLLAVSTAVHAQGSATDFFRGRTITLVVATGAGNGIDLLARVVAAHLGRHVPGNPAVVVRNMPGAGGMVGLQHLFAIAAKDGT